MVGTVIEARPPFCAALSRNFSQESISTFWKNQSFAVLQAFPSLGLYRVVVLPPQRCAVAPMSLSVSAQAIPKIVGLTACPAWAHWTVIGVAALIFPVFGTGPATRPATSSEIAAPDATR